MEGMDHIISYFNGSRMNDYIMAYYMYMMVPGSPLFNKNLLKAQTVTGTIWHSEFKDAGVLGWTVLSKKIFKS